MRYVCVTGGLISGCAVRVCNRWRECMDWFLAVRYVCVTGGANVDRFLAVRYLCVTGGVSVD